MFWKKAKPINPLTVDDVADQRNAFRYVFTDDRQLTMKFKGKTVRVLDISAGGLAFENQGFKKYDADNIVLDLTMPNFVKDPVFSSDLRILHLTENNICHCIFENCSVDRYEMVHKYVLEMQKHDLQKMKQ
ncbi:MAG: hypothetical protein MI892_07480 [Desulfobacterales bacterium]|nr:hypothetical protein [Desulfobacterales bacterium]